MNNDFFLSRVRRLAMIFTSDEVTKSRVKIIAESPHEWHKIVIHGNEYIILIVTRYFMYTCNEHTNPLKLSL